MESEKDILQMAYDSIQAGGAGLSIGRNIFQAENPSMLVKALHGIVHDGWSVDQAYETLKKDDI
jgi:class I fructose-bisphosphate aldolase